MGLVNDFKRWVSGEVDDDDFDMDDETMESAEPEEPSYYSRPEPAASAPVEAAHTQVQPRRNNRVVNISATTRLAVVLVKADQFNNVADIADHLKNKMTVVLNLESTDKEVSKRMLDFLSGVTYAIEGRIKRVASNTYLITPLDVEIVGDDLISELENSGMKF
ncbi:cell division protein SepF [Butyricicoccus sp.]|uniref:cell division protein SepF n=1 Tax=Butyricicoccus sp. TaxID=2049021 RepID=UPI0037363740